jgi:hypothetical protein
MTPRLCERPQRAAEHAGSAGDQQPHRYPLQRTPDWIVAGR